MYIWDCISVCRQTEYLLGKRNGHALSQLSRSSHRDPNRSDNGHVENQVTKLLRERNCELAG